MKYVNHNTAGQEFVFTKWSPPAPRWHDRNCLVLELNQENKYIWEEEDCRIQLPYICYIGTSLYRTRTASYNSLIYVI